MLQLDLLRGPLHAFFIILAILTSLRVSSRASTPPEQPSERALAYLLMMDGHQYAECLRASSAIRRRTFYGHPELWEQAVKSVRGPMGAFVTRLLVRTQIYGTLAGAPDGHLAVVEYQSSFEHQQKAREVVALIDESGEWKVAGYIVN